MRGKKKKIQPKWEFPSQTTLSVPNISFIPESLGVFRCALGYFHPKSLLGLNLGWELGCIPDWGHFWEFPGGEQTQSSKSMTSGVSFEPPCWLNDFVAVIPESAWKNPPKNVLHWKSSSIVQKLEMRYSSCFSLQKNFNFWSFGDVLNIKTPPPNPHLLAVHPEIYF